MPGQKRAAEVTGTSLEAVERITKEVNMFMKKNLKQDNRVLHDIDTTLVATLLMQQVEYAICLECCCVYTDVETAACGHSLCSSCWQSRRVCSMCMSRATQTQRQHNIPLQTLATHSQVLLHKFEKLFHITVDEYLGTASNHSAEKDNTTVKNWFRNSKNKFINSSSEPHSEIVDLHFDGSIKPIQKKYERAGSNSGTVIHKPQLQTDWDKIESMPNSQIIDNSEDQHHRTTQEPVYTCKNPRRSSRNKDLQTDVQTPKFNKENMRSSTTDKKAELAQRNWNSVKKMRKEFSKLNKIHRNKLNVSIENIKRIKNCTKSTLKEAFENLPNTPYVIDEESPMILTHEQKFLEHVQGKDLNISNNIDINQQNASKAFSQGSINVNSEENNALMNSPAKISISNSNIEQEIVSNKDQPTYNKILFFKRGKLCPDLCKEKNNMLKQMRCAACQTSESDDIFIDIKIGNMLTNIVINGKTNVQVKKQTYTQIQNKKDEIMNDQEQKDKSVDSREILVQIPDVSQDSCDLTEKHSLPNEITGRHSKNNSAQMEIVDAQKHTVIVKNSGEVGTNTNIDSEEPDIFNNTPTVQDHVQLLKDADLAPSEILVSVGEKRLCGIDAPIPFAKRVRLSDCSPQASPLNSQASPVPVQQLHSENVFSLPERPCCQSANKPPKFTSIDVTVKSNRHDSYDDKSDNNSLVAEFVSNRSIIEESQCPVAVPIAINTVSNNNINDSVKTAKEFTDSYTVDRIASKCDTHRNHVAIESLPTHELPLRTRTFETPLSMTNFVDSIEHNSTPLARKSLKFEHAALQTGSIDATLCATNTDGPNMQAKESMSMESIPQQPVLAAPISSPCVAGSNLKINELAQLKLLCMKLNWTFLENYSPALTHLVITVDDENKAQRTVKYMCALAAGKWVVSFAWAERCAMVGRVVPEEPFEALDSTGAPGPRRSRMATRQLFAGFTFSCMPPFALLDISTLEGMLKANGARIVESPAAARADGTEPHLVLAGSNQSQTPENRFIFMAMELRVAPVSVDWVVDSLGAYELCPLRDFLLCPVTLVTEYARHWLPPLLDGSADSDFADDSVPPSP